jgi:hypothetical protein
MKMIMLSITIFLTASISYSVPFQPEKMTLSAPIQLLYYTKFGVFHIPLKVTGKPAFTIFALYTKDRGNQIGSFQNGNLGWHYVNKVDTCVYLQHDGLHDVGTSEILWDVYADNGYKLSIGDYTYYILGFDNQSQKIPAKRNLVMGWGEAQPLHIESTDVNGNPISNPVIYHCNEMNPAASAITPLHIYKWKVGSDPDTPLNEIEWTTTGRYDTINRTGGSIALDPLDHSMLYVGEMGKDYATYVTKYKWVPGGPAELQTDWGVDGTYHWTTEKVPGGLPMTGVVSDGADLLFMSFTNQIDSNPFSQMLFVNREDGSKIKTVDMSEWYSSKTDLDNGGQMNGGPTDFDFWWQSGILASAGNSGCTALAIDPYRPTGDEIVWVNKNGDYEHDKNFAPDAVHKWMCNDSGVSPYMFTWKTDDLGFSFFPVNGLGSANFGIIGPSGQGIGNFGTFAGIGSFGAVLPLHVGSAYDGLYMDNPEAYSDDDKAGVWYIGYDAIKGLLKVDWVDEVAENEPEAFSVEQNSPNPFNLSTTISFTLARAGKVTVEIFNISGQKVETLIDRTMDEGLHSVSWNASKHSAGVYFYTVKSGNYSKTMKMTMIK